MRMVSQARALILERKKLGEFSYELKSSIQFLDFCSSFCTCFANLVFCRATNCFIEYGVAWQSIDGALKLREIIEFANVHGSNKYNLSLGFWMSEIDNRCLRGSVFVPNGIRWQHIDDVCPYAPEHIEDRQQHEQNGNEEQVKDEYTDFFQHVAPPEVTV